MDDVSPIEKWVAVASLVVLFLSGMCPYVVDVVRYRLGIFGIALIIFLDGLLWVLYVLSKKEILW